MKIIIFIFSFIFCSMPINGAERVTQPSSQFIKGLQMLMPNIPPDGIYKSEINGIHQVAFGPRLVYVTSDGRYMLKGSFIDLETKMNITTIAENKFRISSIDNAFDENEMIVFSPKKTRHTLTIFTDIDCSFCKKMHRQIDEFLNQGIRIRYLLFPREGMNSASAKNSISIFCEKDKKLALTKAKAGQFVATDNGCDNPIYKTIVMGQMIGIKGTPTIIADNGHMFSGYVSAGQIAQALDILKAQENNLQTSFLDAPLIH